MQAPRFVPGVSRLVFAAVVLASCAPQEHQATPGGSADNSGPTSSELAASGGDEPAFELALDDVGQLAHLVVFDPDSVLAEARPANARERAAVLPALGQGEMVILQGESEKSVLVAWLATVCDRQAGLMVDGSGITLRLATRNGCDAMAIGRAIALEFAEPVPATALEGRLIPATILPGG